MLLKSMLLKPLKVIGELTQLLRAFYMQSVVPNWGGVQSWEERAWRTSHEARPPCVVLLPQEREHGRALRVRLRQSRDAALVQDAVLRQVRRLFSDVRVADPALGGLVV